LLTTATEERSETMQSSNVQDEGSTSWPVVERRSENEVDAERLVILTGVARMQEEPAGS
jgi:hypothetical protein